MTPTQAIGMLDKALIAHGQDVILQRAIGTNQGWISVTIRGQVIGYQPHDLVQGSGVQVGDSKVIYSPTETNAAQWPGGYVLGATTQGDQRIPRIGDRMIIAGKTRTVQYAAPRYLDDELIRIDVQVR